MKAGFSKLDITPPLGCVLNGYYKERYADRVIERSMRDRNKAE